MASSGWRTSILRHYPVDLDPNLVVLEVGQGTDELTVNPYGDPHWMDAVLADPEGRDLDALLRHAPLSAEQRTRIMREPALRNWRAGLAFTHAVAREDIEHAIAAGDLDTPLANGLLYDPTRHGIALAGDALLDTLVARAGDLARWELLVVTEPGRFADEFDWWVDLLTNSWGASSSTVIDSIIAARPDLVAAVRDHDLGGAGQYLRHRQRRGASAMVRTPWSSVANVDREVAEERSWCPGDHPTHRSDGTIQCWRRGCPVVSGDVRGSRWGELSTAEVGWLAEQVGPTAGAWRFVFAVVDSWEASLADLAGAASEFAHVG